MALARFWRAHGTTLIVSPELAPSPFLSLPFPLDCTVIAAAVRYERPLSTKSVRLRLSIQRETPLTSFFLVRVPNPLSAVASPAINYRLIYDTSFLPPPFGERNAPTNIYRRL